MGYLFLAIALLAGGTKGYCGKKTSGYTNNFRDAILANLIRMTLCIVIGFALILFQGELPAVLPSVPLLLLSACSGLATSAFVVVWLLCVKKSAYTMIDVSLMLGLLVPLLLSSFFFGEAIKPTQWIGLAILFIATVIMCSYNNTIKEKLSPASLLLLLLCGLSNGAADFTQKLFTKTFPDGSAAVFNFYTYVFAAIVLGVAFLATKKTVQDAPPADLRKIFGYICIMAICLFANSFFKTLAAGRLDAVLLYPLNQGCALIIAALIASVFFGEKITAKAVIGMTVAFAGLLIVNLL